MNHAKGIHHITAVAGDPQQNLDFYSGILGLRLVKKTVNFDDPSTYHLYYGDATGRPGSILTFFPYENIAQGQPDRGQAIAVSFSVPAGSLQFWSEHLEKQNIDFMDPFERFGKLVIGLQDPDGLHLELVGDPGLDDISGWEGGPVPEEHAIRGLHGITLAGENAQPTGMLLEEFLGFRETEEEHDRILYQSESPLGGVVEVIDGAELDGKPGKGTVHHVAFRAKDEEEQQQMRKKLIEEGYHVTEIKNRHYFRSIYFHEPGGILFEIATDPPGFTLDEEAGSLGTALKLPPWLQEKRELIEADLQPLNII